MTWAEIKSAYTASYDILKTNYLLLAAGFLIAILETLPQLITVSPTGPGFWGIFLITLPISWLTTVWMNQTFDQTYGHRKGVSWGTVGQGLGKLILLSLLVGAALLGIGAAGFLVYLLLSPVSLALLIVLGIAAAVALAYVGIRLFFTGLVAVLENDMPVRALKASWQLTHGKMLKLLGFLAIGGLLGLVSSILVLPFVFLSLTLSSIVSVVTTALFVSWMMGATVHFFRMLQGVGKQAAATDIRAAVLAKPAKKKSAKRKR